MLRLSKKTDYGIILLSHLGEVEAPVSAQEMASNYQLPQPMVANILKQLASAGLVESKRGQRGGYCLSRPTTEINLAEIVQIMDGPFKLVECVQGGCKVNNCCPTQGPLTTVHMKLEEFMSSITLDEIIKHPKYIHQ